MPSPAFKEGVAIGVNRHVVIADTDADAMRIAEPAHHMYHASLTKLWRENKATTPVAQMSVASLEDAVKSGAVIIGAPDTVRREIQRQVDELGLNYMMAGMYLRQSLARARDALAAPAGDRGDPEDHVGITP